VFFNLGGDGKMGDGKYFALAIAIVLGEDVIVYIAPPNSVFLQNQSAF
jgi:hypothetical protein